MSYRPALRLTASVTALLLSTAPLALRAETACKDINFSQTEVGRRTITPLDIAQLGDIGSNDSSTFESENAIALDPGRRRIAFVVRRADAALNSYCNALVMIPLDGLSRPKVLATSEGFVGLAPFSIRGLIGASGVPDANRPLWSPDGKRLLWKTLTGKMTEIWSVEVESGREQRLFQVDASVRNMRWSNDAQSVEVETVMDAEQRDKDNPEARSGYLYDMRYMPNRGAIPQVRSDAGSRWLRIPVGQTTADRGANVIAIPMADAPAIAGSGGLEGRRQDGAVASAQRLSPTVFSERRLEVKVAGKVIACPWEACTGKIYWLDWIPGSDALLFARRSGWRGELITLYRMRPGQRPHILYSGRDVIAGCELTPTLAICLRESAVRPRRVEAMNLNTGRWTGLFDPNPGFAQFDIGAVQRLYWRNKFGFEAWGDLVLPPGFRRERTLPLVVVQYRSRGFLRGGTGDEYPIFALAARGYAVLSVEQPLSFAHSLPGVESWEQANLENNRNWRERESLLSSIETGIDKVRKLGIVDAQRIGITGLSDGGTTVQYALLNSNLFSAAIMSSCCLDPRTVMTYGGPAWATEMKRRGYPAVNDPAAPFWTPMALSLSPERVKAPILMQLPSEEYLLSLEAFTALKDQQRPVELYVFPEERHVKSQPAHRLAIYDRVLDWFDFWFFGKIDPAPEKAAQYRRWRAMRPRADAASVPGTQPRLNVAQTQQP